MFVWGFSAGVLLSFADEVSITDILETLYQTFIFASDSDRRPFLLSHMSVNSQHLNTYNSSHWIQNISECRFQEESFNFMQIN